MKKIKVFAAALMFVVAVNVSASAQEEKVAATVVTKADCTLTVIAPSGAAVTIKDPDCKVTKQLLGLPA